MCSRGSYFQYITEIDKTISDVMPPIKTKTYLTFCHNSSFSSSSADKKKKK